MTKREKKRLANAKWKAANRAKYLAHKCVENQIVSGGLKRQPCQVCGKEELVHAHHDDYAKPFDVMWLCPAHHSKRHATLKHLGKYPSNIPVPIARHRRHAKIKILTSQFRGVSFSADKGRWRAQICSGYKTRHLGYFDEEASAARAYDSALLECDGESAILNFPNETQPALPSWRGGFFLVGLT